MYVFFASGMDLVGSFIMVQHNRNEELEICLYAAKCVPYQTRMDVSECHGLSIVISVYHVKKGVSSFDKHSFFKY